MDSIAAKKFVGIRALVVCLLIGAFYALQKGQDTAWDLKNYHLYNAWSFLHGHLTIDLAPVGLQGFFNPLLDVPYFWLGTSLLHHTPRLLAALQGLWYGGLLFVLLRISVRFSKVRERAFGIPDLLAVIIGATGTMVTSQTGSSTNELPLALLILLGLYVLLPFCARDMPTRPMRRAVVAGLLCGLAAGLKPTAIVYTPALGLALWLALGFGAKALHLSIVFVCAAVGAFLLAYGWWGWELYRLTGNPVFPMFNQVFHSPWSPPSAGTDRQFMPKDLFQWLFYPFFWIQKNRYQGGNAFADARYAVAMIAVAIVAAMSWRSRAREVAGSRAVRLVFVFLVTSYTLWLLLYSILRYAVPIEVMTGLMILVALQELSSGWTRQDDAPRWIVWAMAGIVTVLMGCTRYTDWGHAPYAAVAFDVRPPVIEPGSMVLVIGQPNAYVIPFFRNAQNLEFVGVTWLTSETSGYRLGSQTEQRIQAHPGPMYAITRDINTADQSQLLRFLPSAHFTDCEPIASAMERTMRGTDLSDGLRLCRVIRS
jgi:hypothetical protein